MQISLHSRSRKLLFILVSLVGVAPFLFVTTRMYRAQRYAEKGDFLAAIRLAPQNADYYAQSSQLQLFTETSTRPAIDNLKIAVVLNPFAARSWLALAQAYHVSGASEQERMSIERAISADPTTPEVLWEAATFFAARGDNDTALRYFRGISQYDDDPSPALEAAWRLTQDADQVLRSAMPDTVGAHLAFLRLMVLRNEPSGAQNTWSHLVRMEKPIAPRTVFFYLQYLLDRKDGLSVRNAWRELSAISPALGKYRSPNNLIVNPGFEEEMLNGGLDWQFKLTSGTELAVDTSVFRSGSRSLSIGYGGENNTDAGVF